MLEKVYERGSFPSPLSLVCPHCLAGHWLPYAPRYLTGHGRGGQRSHLALRGFMLAWREEEEPPPFGVQPHGDCGGLETAGASDKARAEDSREHHLSRSTFLKARAGEAAFTWEPLLAAAAGPGLGEGAGLAGNSRRLAMDADFRAHGKA